MERQALKSCPHCGGIAYLTANYNSRYRRYFVVVKCDICGAQGKAYTSTDEPAAADWNNEACIDAAHAWNMRHEPKGE